MFIEIVDQCTFVAVVGSCLYVIKKSNLKILKKPLLPAFCFK